MREGGREKAKEVVHWHVNQEKQKAYYRFLQWTRADWGMFWSLWLSLGRFSVLFSLFFCHWYINLFLCVICLSLFCYLNNCSIFHVQRETGWNCLLNLVWSLLGRQSQFTQQKLIIYPALWLGRGRKKPWEELTVFISGSWKDASSFLASVVRELIVAFPTLISKRVLFSFEVILFQL